MPTTIAPAGAGSRHSAPPAPPQRHVAGLDGLRGMAILLVMLVHAGMPGLELGWLGVDLFFVISGFLITTLLVGEARRSGGVSLARFWGRRFLRLAPAYWACVGFVTGSIYLARWGWTGTARGWGPAGYVASLWLYFTNYLPMAGIWEHQAVTGPYWSLAIEEQFYLIWPLVFVGLGARARRAEPAAWALVAAIFAAGFFVDPSALHFRIYTRGLGIMLGCAVALLAARSGPFTRLLRSGGARVGIAAGCLAVFGASSVLAGGLKLDERQLHLFVLPAFCAAASLLVAMLWYGPEDRIASALAWRPLAYVGKISYGIYLYHEFARHLTWTVLLPGLEGWPRPARYGLRVAAFLAISLGLASISYRVLERPFLALKGRLR